MIMEEIGQHVKDNVAGLTKKQGEEAYNAIVELIKQEANSEDNVAVALPKLGKLNIKSREAYKAKNPRTGADVTVEPSRRVSFAPYTSLKNHLNDRLRSK